ncbi:DUF5067 domain-containing protein [Bifidobacterium simiarum]|uniref:DUF5067 domain-containing protein n=1 Tax=Bifidobacterium simiarum TaxID=2045441 RepID=A0A2M9HEY7_9BIFI|nr:DUF5067 domain-containing protein [Bifidobacterium simiarum]PJM75362.1 hypothetical protein CSQ87_04935 [Bifidobacterium simiarum]
MPSKKHAQARSRSHIPLLIITIVSLAVISLLVIGLVATHRPNNSTSSSTSHTNSTSAPSKSVSSTVPSPQKRIQQGEGNIANGKYHVRIVSLIKSVDTDTKDRQPGVLVTYEITNISNEKAQMTAAIKVSQDGEKFGNPLPDDDALTERLVQSITDSMKPVNPGETQTRISYFGVRNTTSPIQVSIYNNAEDPNSVVTKTFTLQ